MLCHAQESFGKPSHRKSQKSYLEATAREFVISGEKLFAQDDIRDHPWCVKIATAPANGRTKAQPKLASPRMTRRLAEKRAVGDPDAPKFDGVAFLRTLKK